MGGTINRAPQIRPWLIILLVCCDKQMHLAEMGEGVREQQLHVESKLVYRQFVEQFV